MSEKAFLQELTELINRHSCESKSNTPDFVLAQYMMNCLEAFEAAVVSRNHWYSSKNKKQNEFGPIPSSWGNTIRHTSSPYDLSGRDKKWIK